MRALVPTDGALKAMRFLYTERESLRRSCRQQANALNSLLIHMDKKDWEHSVYAMSDYLEARADMEECLRQGFYETLLLGKEF